jgi:hypothetical protein
MLGTQVSPVKALAVKQSNKIVTLYQLRFLILRQSVRSVKFQRLAELLLREIYVSCCGLRVWGEGRCSARGYARTIIIHLAHFAARIEVVV